VLLLRAPTLLGLLLAAAQPGSGPDRWTIQVHYTPQDRESGRYQYVPVDVPAGATRLTLDLRYDRAGGANVVDLGLFEPGPLDLGTPAFRGWSGGERAGVTLSPQYATPGYWPGPLPAGRWNVMLGLYKVAPGGVDVELRAEAGYEPAGAVPSLAARPPEPLRRGAAWYSGGLHMHTVHSDGTLSAVSLARRAREAGLDFIALTDHNNTVHQLEPVESDGLLRIVGEEVTTPGGHANVIGIGGVRDYVDFRVPPRDPRLGGLLQAAHDRGAFVSVNHPTGDCLGCDWDGEVPAAADAIEIVNPGQAKQQQAIELWDRLLRAGRHIVGLGTGDWHRAPQPIDAASVRVWAEELSTAAILRGLRAGRVVVMADGRTPPPELTVTIPRNVARVGDTLHVRRGQTYAVQIAGVDTAYEDARVTLIWDGAPAGEGVLAGGRSMTVTRRADKSGYLRAHVFRKDGQPLAITNPIWIAVDLR
jgi:predicted metal-dependent phosphoesterase TrpH